MHCGQCGTAAPDGALFCAHCGQALAATQKTPHQDKQRQAQHGLTLMASGCLLLLLGLFLLLVVVVLFAVIHH